MLRVLKQFSNHIHFSFNLFLFHPFYFFRNSTCLPSQRHLSSELNRLTSLCLSSFSPFCPPDHHQMNLSKSYFSHVIPLLSLFLNKETPTKSNSFCLVCSLGGAKGPGKKGGDCLPDLQGVKKKVLRERTRMQMQFFLTPNLLSYALPTRLGHLLAQCLQHTYRFHL